VRPFAAQLTALVLQSQCQHPKTSTT
jgi:hypothetical protein